MEDYGEEKNDSISSNGTHDDSVLLFLYINFNRK